MVPKQEARRILEAEERKGIDSGRQTSSITWDNLPPSIALDPAGARFAVAGEKSISVVAIDPGQLGR